jgi:acyl dehydratase
MAVDRFPVEASHIMMFARAIGDPNPAFSDAESPEAIAVGGIVAPPTFPMASMQFDEANPLIPHFGQPWFGSGREATGRKPSTDDPLGDQTVKAGLHAEQSFTYVKPLRPGMVLHGAARPGEVWVKQSKRGGTLTFSEMITEYFDEDGELVVTARLVGVVPEVTPTKES